MSRFFVFARPVAWGLLVTYRVAALFSAIVVISFLVIGMLDIALPLFTEYFNFISSVNITSDYVE